MSYQTAPKGEKAKGLGKGGEMMDSVDHKKRYIDWRLRQRLIPIALALIWVGVQPSARPASADASESFGLSFTGTLMADRGGQLPDRTATERLGIESGWQRELERGGPSKYMLAAATGDAAGVEEPGAPGGGLQGQGADELARKSSNPLGGDFWIILNQIDNYFMGGDAASTNFCLPV